MWIYFEMFYGVIILKRSSTSVFTQIVSLSSDFNSPVLSYV